MDTIDNDDLEPIILDEIYLRDENLDPNKLIPTGGHYNVSSLIKNMKIVNNIDSKIVINGNMYDYKFFMDKGITEDQINELTSIIKYKIPDDYMKFLKLTNGLKLTVESQLINNQDVISYYQKSLYPLNFLIIGFYNTDTSIGIHLNSNDEKYMYILNSDNIEKAQCLDCNFKDFLSRYINSYSICFWKCGVDYSKHVVSCEF